MAQPTPVQVMDTVNVYISDLIDEPPDTAIYTYNPGMRCYDASFGLISTGIDGWKVFIDKALPEDDGLRISIAEHLYAKYGTGAEVVLEWR